MCRKIGGISSIDFIYFCGKKAAPSTGTDWKEAHGRIRDAPEPESEASLMPNTARARETTEEWRFEKGPKKEDKTNLGNFWCVLVLSSACWGSRVGRYVLLEMCAWRYLLGAHRLTATLRGRWLRCRAGTPKVEVSSAYRRIVGGV